MVLQHFSWVEASQLAASEYPHDVEDLAFLAQAGIRAIVTLTEYPLGGKRRGVTPADLMQFDFVCGHFPIVDMRAPDDPFLTHRVMTFMDDMQAQNRPVLLHCLAGQGRTGTLLHAYYLHRGLTLAAAQDRLNTVRPRSAWQWLTDGQQAYLQTLAKTLQQGWQV
ncbi:MAG: hypothetical protein MUE40_10880 [Anaerolineae bacterium]|jgi:atypical dual specificity phosphatase|nr:hypothetical protein [Anaerolineae bacterium]